MSTRSAIPDARPETTEASSPWGTAHPFAAGLRTFFQRLAEADWPGRAPSFVFVRDYEGLPDHAPFDIDAMADKADLTTCRAVFEETANALGLVCVEQPGSTGINILVLELAATPGHRTWAYFEIATHKKLSRDFTVRPEEIDIERTGGLPVPSDAWRFAINLLQALRRSDLARYRPVLDSCLRDTPGCRGLVAEKLGLKDHEIDDILSTTGTLESWQERLGVTVKPPEPATPPQSWRNRLRLAALRRFYLLSAPEMYLVSVHGADGVGKSTACDKVGAMFAGYPIRLDAFHHVTSWKHQSDSVASPPDAVAHAGTTPAPDRPSPLRVILRFGYRAAPEFVRDWWRAVTGYHHYGRSLNRNVVQGYIDHRIMLLDRYVYDMYLKLGIRGATGRLGKLVGYLFCRMMRRPLRAILIVDQPESVIARKQELALDEIDAYQRTMARLLGRLGVRHTIIRVDGRDADSVADELARTIIDAIGGNLIQLMRYTVNLPSTR